MPGRTVALPAIVVVVLQCALSGPLTAQSGSCTGTHDWVYGTQPPGLSLNSPNCVLSSAEVISCWNLPSSSCPPGASPTETQPRCPSCGSPIVLATGNTYIEQRDISVPGLGNGLRLTRTWNSLWPSTQGASQTGLFGPNWRSTYEERVFMGGDGYMKYSRGDGSFWSFGYNTAVGGPLYAVASPANASATLALGTTSWTLSFHNGEQRYFDVTSGNLTMIVDRNGNATALSYDSVGRLVSVTDPASRQLNFNYGNSSSYLITSVTSNIGVSVSYVYDTSARLSTVTEPDGSTFSFRYDSNSFIAAVLDSNAQVLEMHTYDSMGRGLTSSRANGVDVVTVSYSSQ
jgi:YD repeat-containing protein